MGEAFVFENGLGNLADFDIGLGETFRNVETFFFAAEFCIGLLQNLQRLIIVWLRFRDCLKHLDSAKKLLAFLF